MKDKGKQRVRGTFSEIKYTKYNQKQDITICWSWFALSELTIAYGNDRESGKEITSQPSSFKMGRCDTEIFRISRAQIENQEQLPETTEELVM